MKYMSGEFFAQFMQLRWPPDSRIRRNLMVQREHADLHEYSVS